MSDDLLSYCLDVAQRAKTASITLANARALAKNNWLNAAATRLRNGTDAILAANRQDLEAAPGYGLNAAAVDRLTLTPARIGAAADGLQQIAALPDPVGEVREGGFRPNGLQVLKVGVPLGVIFFLYESRPNVTVDAAGLSVKSGNAVILRGGKEARFSNAALHRLLTEDLPRFDLPADAVQLVSVLDREAVGHFLKMKDWIDLAIPRGGESLIRRVAAEATMPVMKHFQGNCHIFIDRAADPDMAERIVVNAKCQRPGVCNAAESLLVHSEIAQTFVPRIVQALQNQKVEVRGCEQTATLAQGVVPATDEDHATEFLDRIISMKVVADFDAAVSHINRYGSQHTEAIITSDLATARRFTQVVDASAVMVNASTRFNDGFELGLGAEIGISTDKFHARGPCGLKEMTTYKYIVIGDGQIRE